MISLSYGFKNRINPLILAHPANCELLQHIDNSKKKIKCSITIDVLLDRIKNWDSRYGAYYNFKLNLYDDDYDKLFNLIS